MAHIIEISDLNCPELAPFFGLTGRQMRSKRDPDKALFIAESPKVILCALRAGCEPLSLLMERRQLPLQSDLLLRCGEIPVYTADREVLEQRPVAAEREDVVRVLSQFTGLIEQLPPMYSAIKINGKKLYELARKGQEVERKPRPVTIHALEILEQTAPDRFSLRVRCSKGTYVRTLCHEIGQALGCGGCMDTLRRTMAAGFTLADVVTLEQVQETGEALLRPVDSLFGDCPAYHIPNPGQERLCRNGNPLPAADMGPGEYRVYAPDGTFLCLSRWEKGQLVSIKNFFGG